MNPRKEIKAAANFAREQARQRAAELAEASSPKDTTPLVTLVPAPVSKYMPPKKKKETPEEERATGTSQPFDTAAEATPKYIETSLFARIAQRQLQSGSIDPSGFRTLCATAIGLGGVSLQEIVEEYGDVIPRDVERNLNEWPLPKPDIMRSILEKFSTVDEDQFTGSKLPWRHAQSAPTEEGPEPQG